MLDCKNIGDILHYVKDCAYFANVFNRYNKILYLEIRWKNCLRFFFEDV